MSEPEIIGDILRRVMTDIRRRMDAETQRRRVAEVAGVFQRRHGHRKQRRHAMTGLEKDGE